MPAQTALTEFDAVLVTIRSGRSFFEVTKAVEASLQRLSVSRLMEHVARGDRKGLEAYVDQVSAPSKFSIFWEMDQGPAMRLAGIPMDPSSTWSATPSSPEICSATPPPPASERRCVSASPSATVKKRASTWTRPPPSSANSRKRDPHRCPSYWIQKWSRSSKTPPLRSFPSVVR